MKRIGVLGYGSRIRGVIHNVVESAPEEVRVEAFYDRSAEAVERTKEKNPGIRVCNSTEELVGMDELDWIFIGSFNAAHYEHAIPAIKAGKHVFCEKPLATTRQDCLDILQAHRAHSDQSFGVGFVLRYSLFYRAIKQMIDEGKLGDLISMEFNETLAPQHGASMHGNWRRRSDWSGPMILEKCCHDIDLMHWLTNSRPAQVASFGSLNFFNEAHADYNDLHPKNEEDGYGFYERGLANGYAVGLEENISPFSGDKDTIDNQVAIMKLENGANLSFHYCMHAAQTERRFYMCGTRGTIRANVLNGTIEYKPVGWKTEVQTIQPIKGDGHGGAEQPMTDDILACMFEGTPMPTTVEDGVTASFTCLGMEESRHNGSIVNMDEYWSLI
jgi:predicted dehydrogenase